MWAAVLRPILVRNMRRRCAPAAVAMSTAPVAKLVAAHAHLGGCVGGGEDRRSFRVVSWGAWVAIRWSYSDLVTLRPCAGRLLKVVGGVVLSLQ